ncbi:hypothetical protein H3C70_05270 [Patescibacteria group bacterium]|nr:hypothetical protein [Patescibacteria group bacterium]
MAINLNADIIAQLKQINYRRLIFVRRFLILSVIMAIVSVCIALFAVLPQIEQIIQTQNMIRTENTTLQNLRRKIQGLAQVNDLEEYANKDKVDQALPFQKPLLPVLETARRVSLQTGARLTSIETSPGKLASISAQQASVTSVTATGAAQTTSTPASAQQYDVSGDQVHGVDKMDIEVTIQGTLAQISAFISEIERSTPITNVTEIRLDNEVRSADGTSEFTANLRLSAYYFTRAIQVAIDAPLPETGAKERAFLQELETYTIGNQTTQSMTVEGGGRDDLFGIPR